MRPAATWWTSTRRPPGGYQEAAKINLAFHRLLPWRWGCSRHSGRADDAGIATAHNHFQLRNRHRSPALSKADRWDPTECHGGTGIETLLLRWRLHGDHRAIPAGPKERAWNTLICFRLEQRITGTSIARRSRSSNPRPWLKGLIHLVTGAPGLSKASSRSTASHRQRVNHSFEDRVVLHSKGWEKLV